MIKNLIQVGLRLKTDKKGSVAVETGIILPLILVPFTLATVDVGIAVHSGQSLTSASRSGTQYLLNGGKSETDLRSAIVSSYSGTLNANNISVSTQCACPNLNALPPVAGVYPDEETVEQPYTLRSVTLASIDQCTALCADLSTERVLVQLSIASQSNGLYKNYPLLKEVSVRLK